MENRQPLVAGNWKLNGSRSSVIALAESVSKGLVASTAEVLLCPSHVHLSDVLGIVGNTAIRLGAQDCTEFDAGAYTGETAADMLTEFGCEYVIVGHSERRQMFGDTDTRVAAKAVAVQKAGMTPILCVGETLEQREAGQVDQIVGQQLDAVYQVAAIDPGNLVVAYEPVWAIGTGRTASPEQAQAVHASIRSRLAQVAGTSGDASSGAAKDLADRTRILYGGSVNAGNAGELFAQTDIDGGLVGGASLKADDFLAICAAA